MTNTMLNGFLIAAIILITAIYLPIPAAIHQLATVLMIIILVFYIVVIIMDIVAWIKTKITGTP